MQDFQAFALWLKRRRKALDLTRDALAGLAHCSVSTVRRLEANDLRPSKQLAESLAEALQIPSDQRGAFVQFARGGPQPSPFTLKADTALAFSSPVSSRPSAIPNNVPAPLTSLIGRKREIADVCSLLWQPGVRLLTLTGPPGVGKTRLSIAVAHALIEEQRLFPDGVYFVALAPIADPSLVPSAIAQVLSVREAAGNLLAPLREYVRPKHMLLILDNFEQVVEAAPLIADLLTVAPEVKALVTSREVLHVYGEHDYPVPALALPDVHHLPTSQALSFYTRFAAIQLFRERAHAAKSDFQLTPENAADIARICAWLDGLPLAIEMAAAQAKWQPVDRLLAQLTDRLETLTGGPRDLAPRQQSLRGALAWSYDLLDAAEQRLFRMLGVFAGGGDESAIAEVWAHSQPAAIYRPGSEIRSLVDKSLLRYELSTEGVPRYVMLESVREYAQDKQQENGERDDVQQAHADYYLKLMQDAVQQLQAGPDQVVWLDRLEQEQDNFRAALNWAVESPAHQLLLIQLVVALYEFWKLRSHLSEGRHWLEIAAAIEAIPAALRASVLNKAGAMAWRHGDYDRARTLNDQALNLQQQLGDRAGVSLSLQSLAIIDLMTSNFVAARDLLERSLAIERELGQPRLVAHVLNNLAIVAKELGEPDRAEALFGEALELKRAEGDLYGTTFQLHGLGTLAAERQAYAQAASYYREEIALLWKFGDRRALALGFASLADLLAKSNDSVIAAQLLGAADALRQSVGFTISLDNLAEYESIVAGVQAHLEATAFQTAWREGQALALDKAVALALK
ncbi:MAG TPA: tetratricopeptide repeat protein [Anaerolineae bacterium]|nr:tetratricopeptide repeat protein [Anaerolineae bacterium]